MATPSVMDLKHSHTPSPFTQTVPFFELARELRDIIYEHYVKIDGGYVFNPDSGKLKPASPDVERNGHHFGLHWTCRQAASEMSGLSLTYNTVTFSTIANMRESAFRFSFLQDMFLHAQVRDFNRLLDRRRVADTDQPRTLLPGLVRDIIRRQFPEFSPILDVVDRRDESILDSPLSWHLHMTDTEPSMQRQFLDFIMRHLANASPGCIENPAIYELGIRDRLGNGSLQEWRIPTTEELNNAATILKPALYIEDKGIEQHYASSVIEFDRIWEGNRFIYRYSAAAAAIHFLNQHPRSRVHLRRVILNEDYDSVGFPACHGKGLVSLCRENPSLRIERRVSVWRNLFPMVATCSRRRRAWMRRLKAMRYSVLDRAAYLQFAEAEYEGGVDPLNSLVGDLPGYTSTWIREAAALPSSISVLFDGGPAPEQASDVFAQYVVKRAIWQHALEQSYASGWLPDDPTRVYSAKWWEWQGKVRTYVTASRRYTVRLARQQGFVCSRFPNLIRDLVQGLGPIRCNFPLCMDVWDAEASRLVWDQRDWTEMEWGGLSGTRPWGFNPLNTRRALSGYPPTAAPLPSFRALLEDNLLPKRSIPNEDTISSVTSDAEMRESCGCPDEYAHHFKMRSCLYFEYLMYGF